MIRKTKQLNPHLQIKHLCKIAEIKRSSYYAYLKSYPRREQKDNLALEILRPIFEKSEKKAGIQMLDMLLRREKIIFNHKKIARLKREYGLTTVIRKKNPYKNIPKSSEAHKEIPNLLQRDFYPPLPGLAYSTDMTYLFYGSCERAYLSAVKDLATNEIVSYRLMKKPAVAAFVYQVEDFFNTIEREDVIFHSDQGYQYTHETMVKKLHELGVRQSMSRRGNCLDNAAIESFFGHFKDLLELKRCKTFEDVEEEVRKKMHYYNYERPQKGLNKKPPAEYRGLLSGFFECTK